MSTRQKSDEAEARDKPDRYTIVAIDKALDVIEELSMNDSLSLIELADRVKQPKSSLYRIMLTLEKRGFISRSEEDGKYCLGYKQLVITKNLMERNSLRSAAMSEMTKLVSKYGDTVNLCVLSDRMILYMEIIQGTHALRMSDQIGSRAPFHATATGKAIAAYLPAEEVDELIHENEPLVEITPKTIVDAAALRAELELVKKQGYAIDDEEMTRGARCIGVPVFNMFGRVEGAISLSGAIHRFPEDQLAAIAQDIVLAGRNISQKLGYELNPS